MDGVLVVNVFGIWCLDPQLTVIKETTVGDTTEEIVERLSRIFHETEDHKLGEFLTELGNKGIKRFFVESQKLADNLSQIYEVNAVVFEDVQLWRRVRQHFLGPRLNSEKQKTIHAVALQISQKAIREASEQKDQLIIQAMNALDDIERMQNLVASRLREWYGLHFPEATQRIENILDLATLVVKGGQRTHIQESPELEEMLLKISGKALPLEDSMGADISDHDMKMIQNLAKQFLELQNFRNKLEEYIDDAMQQFTPNLRGLVGPIIGARLIGLAGGLEKLSRLPASTIQVLGAETAMFRALKTGARPPKHGVIFQHTLVHSAPWWQRGKIARIIAGKIAIASRIDMFSGEYVADELKQNITQRIAEVKRKYPTGPKTKPRRKPSQPRRPSSRRKSTQKKPASKGRKRPRFEKRKR